MNERTNEMIVPRPIRNEIKNRIGMSRPQKSVIAYNTNIWIQYTPNTKSDNCAKRSDVLED